MKILFCILLISLLSACSAIKVDSYINPDLTDVKKNRALMTGAWYGDLPTMEGGRKRWLIKRLKDGTYTVKYFIVDNDGCLDISEEFGLWGISGPIYFTITKEWKIGRRVIKNAPSNPFIYTAYEVVKLNNDVFKYRSYKSGNIYKIIKVSSHFTLKHDYQKKCNKP